MSWAVPAALEDIAYASARAVVGDAALGTSALIAAIVDRSKRYTSDRARLAAPRDAVGDLAARAVFFTIADAMKIAVPLGELQNRGALPARRPLRVVDLGAGCGAMTLGLIAALPGVPLEVTLIDRDARALEIAARAIRAFASAAVISIVEGDVSNTRVPACDLAVAGTVLNELAPGARVALVEKIVAALADDGAAILVEPALRETSRALHELRDAVIGAGTAHVFAPCTRAIAPCPMLANPSDWCHEDRALALPPRTAELARITHLRDGGMKFSYLVLRRAPLALVEAPPGALAWRVVSAPIHGKGKLELEGCSAPGKLTLRLLRRHRTSATKSFERADRGDVLVTIAAPADEHVEITADTPVARVEPASGR